MKVLRQHANDGVGYAAQIHGLAYDIFSASEESLPRTVADDHDIRGAFEVLAGPEIAAQDRLDSKSVKEPVAYPGPLNQLRPGRGSHHVAGSGEDIHRAEHLILLLPIEIVEIGEIGSRNQLSRALCYVNQARRVAIGQRFNQGRVDEAEYGHTHPHAKRQHQENSAGESRVLAQLAQRKPNILNQAFDEGNRAAFTASLLGWLDAAQFQDRLAPCFVRLHANAYVVIDM